MERIPKLLNIPKNLVDEIEMYQKRNYLASFTGAVLELIREGLNAKKKR